MAEFTTVAIFPATCEISHFPVSKQTATTVLHMWCGKKKPTYC